MMLRIFRYAYMCLLATLLATAGMYSNCLAQITADEIPANEPGKSRHNNSADKLFFVELNVGAAVPLSDYGSQSLFNQNAAYARPGVNIYVNTGKLFNRFIGVIGTVGYIRHPAHKENILTLIKAGQYPASVTNFQYKGFHHLYVAGGMVLHIPASSSVGIDIRVEAGYGYGIDKELSYVVTDLTGSYQVKFATGRDVAFLVNPGVTFKMFSNNIFTISTTVDYMYAGYKYRNVDVSINNTPVDQIDYDLPMHNLSVGIGIGIVLD